MGQIGKDPSSVVPALVEVLKRLEIQHPKREPIDSLLFALGKFGPAAKSASPFLADIVRSDQESPVVRENAIEILPKLGQEGLSELEKLRSSHTLDSRFLHAIDETFTKLKSHPYSEKQP